MPPSPASGPASLYSSPPSRWSLPRRTAPGYALALVVPSLLFLILYSFYTPSIPLIQPDSAGYLTFSAGRSGGYPAFLAAFKPFLADVYNYTVVQRGLFALAVAVLGHQLFLSFGSLTVALVAEVALLFNPDVNRYHFSIMTESLFLSLTALLLAAVLAHLRSGRLMPLLAASALTACAALVRPSALVLLPLLLVSILTACLIHKRSLWQPVLASAATVLALLAIEGAFYKSIHPGPRASLAPIHLLAKAALVEVPDAGRLIEGAPAEAKPLQTELEFGFAPVRKLIHDAPHLAARCMLLGNYEVYGQYEFALEQRAQAIGQAGINRLTPVALDRLREDMDGYARLSGTHLACLWALASITGEEKKSLAAYLESNHPVPFEEVMLSGLGGSRSPPFPTAVRVTMTAIAVILILPAAFLLASLIRRKRPDAALAVAGYAGLAVHASLLFVAMSGVGIPRYVLGLWVLMVIGVGTSIIWLGRSCRLWRIGSTDSLR